MCYTSVKCLRNRVSISVSLGYEHAVGHVIKSLGRYSRFDHIPTACSYPNETLKNDFLFLIFLLIYKRLVFVKKNYQLKL